MAHTAGLPEQAIVLVEIGRFAELEPTSDTHMVGHMASKILLVGRPIGKYVDEVSSPIEPVL